MEDLCRQVLNSHPEGRQIERAMLARGLYNLTRLAAYAGVDSTTVQRFIGGTVDEGTKKVWSALGLWCDYAPVRHRQTLALPHS